MPTIVETLQQYSEPIPDWLRQTSPRFDRKSFFGSRTVYYPGYGNDGYPVKVCARAHAAHAFVYVDYGVCEQTVKDRLQRKGDPAFRGYDVEHEEEVREIVLLPNERTEEELSRAANCIKVNPFRLYVVLKRDKDHDDTQGPERLAMLFVGGDGFVTYNALYCHANGTPPPFLAMLQDHGYGKNYDEFCAGGLLERIARRCGAYPEWLIVGRPRRRGVKHAKGKSRFKPWRGYRDAEARSELGGMHGSPRRLFHRDHWPVRHQFR